MRGTGVEVQWDQPNVEEIVIAVHHHLRHMPVIARWRLGQTKSTSENWLPAEFREPGFLYFRHPGGRRIELCEAPGRRLVLHDPKLEAAPVLVDSSVVR